MIKINENGRSMVEMLGVLAIIGVLSAGGLAGYSKAMFKHKMNSTLDQLTMLVTNIRTMYGTQDNYKDLTAAQAIKLGIIPAAMQNGSALVSPFKGAVTIGTSTAASSGIDDTAFIVTYKDLPSEACINLATADWGSGAGSGFIGVAAASDGSASAADKYVGATTEGKPLKVSDAITACGQTNKSSVSLKFY
ncbi:MAG TPA: hypothetical protein DIC64_02585 [Alphaproteobacteria bacterium]|nr:hypothetical protein [Alphaproteobacteria bacterium]